MDHDPVASIQTLPAIALRGLTVFPNVLIHFDVGRAASIKAMEAAMAAGEPVFLVGQKDMTVERPERDDLYTVGTLSNVRQILRMPGDNVRVMVEGISRARLRDVTQREPYLMAEIEAIPEEKAGRASAKTEALMRSTYEMFQNYTELAPKISPDLLINVLASDDPGYIADYIAQNIAMRNSDKQAILEELQPVRRLEKLHRLLEREVETSALRHVMSLSGGQADLTEVLLPTDFALAGQTLTQAPIPPEVVLVSITRNERLLIPRGRTVLLPGDRVLCLARDEGLRQLMRDWKL